MLIFTESARGEELGQGQDQEADQGHEEADQGQLLIQQSMVLFLPKIYFLNFESWNFDEFFLLFHYNKLHILYISDPDLEETGITLICNEFMSIDG